MPKIFQLPLTWIILLVVVLLTAPQAHAAKMVWQDRSHPINYVALDGLKQPKADSLVIQHPHTFDPQQLTDMLLSLEYNKDRLFRKELKGRQVFFRVDQLKNKFIPHLVVAFQKAKPNQEVVFSVVQKDPYFIVRNDRLNVIRAFVAQDGLHLRFEKIDAKLLGEYEDRNRGERLVENAESIGVVLALQEGQKLSTNPREIILDLNYDFASLLEKKAQEAPAQAAEKAAATPKKQKSSDLPQIPGATDTSSSVKTQDIDPSSLGRLKALKEAKEQGLITNHEYEEKKKEILKQW